MRTSALPSNRAVWVALVGRQALEAMLGLIVMILG